ncbi:MAG: hypothetical protein GXZ07_09260 [Firmicutes bacterium]|nr:hypothetical protein [Bacillota bacterium]
MMKKMAVLIIISLLLVVWASGCTESDYEVYMKASERTGNVLRGKSELKMTMKLKFNKEGLSGDVSDVLEMFEETAFELRREYDREREESLNKLFVNLKDMGFDAKVYAKGDVAYVITPLIPKIVVIKGEEFINPDLGAEDIEKMPALSQESLEAIEKVWKSLYGEENVSALEKIVLDTPEGSVKATRYEINLRDEQLKPAIRKTMEIVLNDSAFMKGLEEMMRSAITEYAKDDAGIGEFQAEYFSFAEVMRSHMEAIENSTIKAFSQTAFIDRDNYIIEERFKIDVLYHFTGAGAPDSFSMEMTIKNWDLNRRQEIYFPEVTNENSITLKELKDEYKGGLNLFKGETD